MKFIHLADVHASKERYPWVSKALESVIERCMKEDISAVIIAGDFWDNTVTVSDSSHFNDYIEIIKRMASYTTVVFIYGTPSHENNGSLKPFSLIENVVVIDSYIPSEHTVFTKDGSFVLLSLPEPRLSLINGDNLEEKFKNIQTSFKDFADEIEQKDYSNTPVICAVHNEIAGCKYQNGAVIPSGRATIDINLLKRLKADYYACGHIHEPQKLGHRLNGGYCGSLVPINFGETHSARFTEIEINKE